MTAKICNGFVAAPLYVRPTSFSGRALRVTRQVCSKQPFGTAPLRRCLIVKPLMCSGHGGHGGGDIGFSFDVGHSAGMDHSPSIDVGHSHSSDAGHSHSSDLSHSPSSEADHPTLHNGTHEHSGKRRIPIGDSFEASGDSGYPSVSDAVEGIVQGPSQAPTKEGVSTAGMAEEDAMFITACYDANVVAIETALDNDQDVNVLDVNRRSALHFCAGNGLPTLCRRLLEMGAKINARDILGFTPLHMATGYKKLDTVKVLIEAKADANIASLQDELAVEIAERMFENTPQKKFFMKNDDYSRLKDMVQILDEATELEEEEVEEEVRTVQIVEESVSAKFTVRVKQKSDSSTPRPPEPPASDVKVTIRVKQPKK